MITNIEVKSIYGQNELIITTSLPCKEAIPKFTDYKDMDTERGKVKMEWGINEFGIVHFGLLYEDKNFRPESGNYWSSNSDAFKRHTGISTIRCCLITKEGWKMATHILLDKVNEILPCDYYIAKDLYGHKICKKHC